MSRRLYRHPGKTTTEVGEETGLDFDRPSVCGWVSRGPLPISFFGGEEVTKRHGDVHGTLTDLRIYSKFRKSEKQSHPLETSLKESFGSYIFVKIHLDKTKTSLLLRCLVVKTFSEPFG